MNFSDSEKMVPKLTNNISNLQKRIHVLKSKIQKFKKILEQRDELEIPTLDGYIDLKLKLAKARNDSKVRDRKANIERLRKANQLRLRRQHEMNDFHGMTSSGGQNVKSPMKGSPFKRKVTVMKTTKGNLFKGPTFDLIYSLPVARQIKTI